jgi:hypothetical protein
MNEGSNEAQQLIPPGSSDEQLGQISELIQPAEEPQKPVAAPVEPEAPAAEEPAPEPETDGEADDLELPAAASLDYDQAIPIGAGHEDATLGQLKDFWKENQDWQTERAEWDTTRTGQENEQMVVRQELGKLVNLLGDVSPAVLEQLQRMNSVNAAREEQLLLQARPEWADPTVKAAASEKMLALAKEYGFTDAQYNGFDDHRIFKFMSDHVKLIDSREAGKAAREKAVADKAAGKLDKPAPKRNVSKSARDKKLRDAAAAGSDDQKAAYITNLIK